MNKMVKRVGHQCCISRAQRRIILQSQPPRDLQPKIKNKKTKSGHRKRIDYDSHSRPSSLKMTLSTLFLSPFLLPPSTKFSTTVLRHRNHLKHCGGQQHLHKQTNSKTVSLRHEKPSSITAAPPNITNAAAYARIWCAGLHKLIFFFMQSWKLMKINNFYN